MGIPLFVMAPPQSDNIEDNLPPQSDDIEDNLPPPNVVPRLVRQNAVRADGYQYQPLIGVIPNIVTIQRHFYPPPRTQQIQTDNN